MKVRRSMVPELPDELILDIFSRIPPRNVLKMCSLSKNLHSMLSSEYFRSLHMHNHFTMQKSKRRLWRFPIRLNDEAFSLLSEDHRRHVSLLRCRRNCSNPYSLIGIINGVVCLAFESIIGVHKHLLWNPIIKRKIVLPAPPRPAQFHRRLYLQSVGFAYDNATNDYKIFSFWNENKIGKLTLGKPAFDVFSKNTGKWVRVKNEEESKFTTLNGSFAAFLKGSCHWAVYGQRNDDDCWTRCFVLAVGASDCAVSLFEVPDAMRVDVMQKTAVGVIEGCLALIPTKSLSAEELVVWVMNEYGDASSWSVRYRVVGESSSILWADGPLLAQSGEVSYHGVARPFWNEGLEDVKLACDGLCFYAFAQSVELLRDGQPCKCFCPSYL